MAKNIISVTTISQLPSITKDRIASSSIFETGVKVTTSDAADNKFTSYKVSYGELSTLLSSNIDDVLYPKYEIERTKTRLTDLESNNMDIDGVKNFKSAPQIDGKTIVTTETVQSIIDDSMPGFIKSTSNKKEYTLSWGDTTSHSYDPYISQTTIIEKTGNLVIYGWMADNGDVAPAQAWVSLDGQIQNSQDWTILQLNPWSISTNSNKLQYISFNLPVAAGLKIRVRTGFPVNTNVSGSQNINKSLVTGNNISTGFKCYIIYNETSV